jgi:hypothetical protein
MRPKFRRLKTRHFGYGNTSRHKTEKDWAHKPQKKTSHWGQGQPKIKDPGPPGLRFCREPITFPLVQQKNDKNDSLNDCSLFNDAVSRQTVQYSIESWDDNNELEKKMEERDCVLILRCCFSICV